MKTLYLVSDPENNNKPLWLTDDVFDYQDKPETYTVSTATKADLTPLLVAEYLDQECEGCNSHEFVGVHKSLANMLAEVRSDYTAALMMRAILAKGGLHKMRS